MRFFRSIAKFFDAQRRWPWIALALLLKFSGVLFFLLYNRETAGTRHLALEHGDSFSYLGPIDNWIRSGSYTPDLRMPGYGVVYWILRSFADPVIARDLLVLAQLVLAALAVYIGARVAQHISGRPIAFVIMFIVLGVSPYMSTLESRLCTESFCTSALIFLCWALIHWRHVRRERWLLLAGGLITWAVFLRPPSAITLLVFGCMILFEGDRTWRARSIALGIFILPFAITDGAWTIRNFRVNHAFHPLTNGMVYTNPSGELYRSALELVKLYGGHTIWWDERADVAWFNARDVGTPPPKDHRAPAPPSWFTTQEFNADSLMDLAAETKAALAPDIDSSARAPLLRAAMARYDHYAASAREQMPYRTQVWARIMSTWNFCWQYGSAGLFYNPWERSSLPAKAMKVYQGAIYLVAIFLGLVVGLARMFSRSTDPMVRAIAWSAVLGMLVIPLLFRFTEYRYSVPCFPFLAMHAVDQLLRWWASFRS